MLVDVIEAKPLAGSRLWLRFEDGLAGEIDVAMLVPFEGVFAPLRDPALFARLEVNSELGTVVWPNGADLDPDVLYGLLSGEPVDLAPPTRSVA